MTAIATEWLSTAPMRLGNLLRRLRPVHHIDWESGDYEQGGRGEVAPTLEEAFAWLDASAKIGLLEAGYVSACKGRGHTTLRAPWIRKGEERVDFDDEPEQGALPAMSALADMVNNMRQSFSGLTAPRGGIRFPATPPLENEDLL